MSVAAQLNAIASTSCAVSSTECAAHQPFTIQFGGAAAAGTRHDRHPCTGQAVWSVGLKARSEWLGRDRGRPPFDSSPGRPSPDRPDNYAAAAARVSVRSCVAVRITGRRSDGRAANGRPPLGLDAGRVSSKQSGHRLTNNRLRYELKHAASVTSSSNRIEPRACRFQKYDTTHALTFEIPGLYV